MLPISLLNTISFVMNCKITINEHENHFMVNYISYFCLVIQIMIPYRKSNMTLTVRKLLLVSVSIIVFLFTSCNSKHKGANSYLNDAQAAYNQGNYSLAKLKIDSIKILYPGSFNEITKGFDLMQDIRLAENLRNIAYCDSMLEVNYRELKASLNDFNYVRDPQYQEFGDYIPKILPLDNAYSQNGLRTAVNENGKMYIESVLSGQPIKHNKIKVSTKDGSYAESLAVTSDGLNYRFNTLGKSYEIVRFTGDNDNGVANFIYTFNDEPITLTFIGQRQSNVALSANTRKAIKQAFELSTLLLNIEDLKYEKGRSEALINYLESKSNK